jgi:hypothetical protein
VCRDLAQEDTLDTLLSCDTGMHCRGYCQTSYPDESEWPAPASLPCQRGCQLLAPAAWAHPLMLQQRRGCRHTRRNCVVPLTQQQSRPPGVQSPAGTNLVCLPALSDTAGTLAGHTGADSDDPQGEEREEEGAEEDVEGGYSCAITANADAVATGRGALRVGAWRGCLKSPW